MQFRLPSKQVIIEIHEAVIEISGGKGEILHPQYIEGATHRPKTYMSYNEDCDLHLVCAIMLDSLARNHAFYEGNKRTALLTMLYTYKINGTTLHYSLYVNKEFVDLVLWVVLDHPTIPEIKDRLEKLITEFQAGKLQAFLELLNIK